MKKQFLFLAFLFIFNYSFSVQDQNQGHAIAIYFQNGDILTLSAASKNWHKIGKQKYHAIDTERAQAIKIVSKDTNQIVYIAPLKLFNNHYFRAQLDKYNPQFCLFCHQKKNPNRRDISAYFSDQTPQNLEVYIWTIPRGPLTNK